MSDNYYWKRYDNDVVVVGYENDRDDPGSWTPPGSSHWSGWLGGDEDTPPSDRRVSTGYQFSPVNGYSRSSYADYSLEWLNSTATAYYAISTTNVGQRYVINYDWYPSGPPGGSATPGWYWQEYRRTHRECDEDTENQKGDYETTLEDVYDAYPNNQYYSGKWYVRQGPVYVPKRVFFGVT